jgi:type I restriction enzyme M protein
MKTEDEGGSRLAIVFNGSPLFAGGPNSGESSIRRWMIENDWLESIIALPNKLFYNTGIHTFILVLSNRKPEERQGSVQLIDARDLYNEMPRNLGDKSHELSENHIEKISQIFGEYEESERSKIFSNEEFGYRRIAVDQPLRLSFKFTDDRIESLEEERAFTNRSEAIQEQVKESLRSFDSDKVWMDADEFHDAVQEKFEEDGIDVRKSVHNALERALGERDSEAKIVKDSNGNPEHDGELRQYEKVPLGTDPHEFFEEEVKPYVSEAWINEDNRYYDDKDGELGQVGYEIHFKRYFNNYHQPRSLEEIDQDIQKIEDEIIDLIGGITE